MAISQTKRLISRALLLLFIFTALSVHGQTTSSNISLVWEVGLQTPPFYKGKTLNVRNTPVTITALSNAGLSSNNLIYTWSESNTVLGGKSGLGRNTLSLPGNIVGDSPFVSVKVETIDKTLVGNSSINIPFHNSRSYIYEYSPTLGVLFENALQNTFNLTNNEVTLQVFPFYFSKSGISRLDYQWKLNRKTLVLEQGPSLTVRKPDGTTGDSILEVSVNNTKEITQHSETSVRVLFD